MKAQPQKENKIIKTPKKCKHWFTLQQSSCCQERKFWTWKWYFESKILTADQKSCGNSCNAFLSIHKSLRQRWRLWTCPSTVYNTVQYNSFCIIIHCTVKCTVQYCTVHYNVSDESGFDGKCTAAHNDSNLSIKISVSCE